MCDQTEVIYNKGDVVWVKLGPVWWPGQVQDYDALPEEITSNLRKKPIAVVKFFQEDTFEYVKNLNHIYHYNCRKKEEFIKKGLDMVRSSNSRDVPSNMKMFPDDIIMAEHITGGDPNILANETFAPEQKSDYSELFGTKKSASKKCKSDSKKEREDWKPRSRSLSLKNGRQSLPVLPSNLPRPITHPRFLTKALQGKSDHEVRIRCQIPIKRHYEDKPYVEKSYTCHICEFHTTRLNVIVLHNKSHSDNFIEAKKPLKAKLKSRDREIFSPVSISEQTPKIVSSRGRIKSVPKKLMDYTDEPPAKIYKDKTYNKEEGSESPSKPTSPKPHSKTPKKEKDNVEKPSIKRPLFGKRKTAKEKAELAAKQKLENEAMKETLLKDWDDDDVIQEEGELEQLKEVLESTPSSIELEDSSDSQTFVCATPEHKVTEDKRKILDSKSDLSSDIKAKIFEFDDSEDSLPVTNFRQKSQRDKFTDDKFKKPKPPKPLAKVVTKSKPIISFTQSLKQEDDKEAEEFAFAFNSLLEETSLPVLPELPKTSSSYSKSTGQTSEQTSDISSSTDLVGDCNIIEESDSIVVDKEAQEGRPESNVIGAHAKLECTSSDSEDQVTEPVVPKHNIQKTSTKDEKNINEVSASEPNVEMDLDVSLSGTATTTADKYKPLNTIISVDKISISKEDSSMTEISSTCDIAKTYNEDLKNIDKDEFTIQMEFKTEEEILETNNSNEGPEENCFQITDSSNILEEENINIEDIGNNSKYNKPGTLDDCSTYVHPINDDEPYKGLVNETAIDPITKVTESDDEHPNEIKHLSEKENSSTCITSNQSVPQTTQFQTLQDEVTISGSEFINNDVEPERGNNEFVSLLNAKTSDEKEVLQSFKADMAIGSSDLINNSKLEECKQAYILSSNKISDEEIFHQSKGTINISGQSTETSSSMQSLSAEQFVDDHSITSVDTVTKSCQFNDDSLSLAITKEKEEIIEPIRVETKDHSQNIQDMEFDINSMPVIIGDEDFVHPEEPKQSLASLEPNYSESIVISPKVIPTTKKSEGVIMQLGEPSTSNKHLQPVIAIPSKSGKSGTRGSRSQKTTSKTIKLPAGTLKNLGALQKGGNQQVLILKTASSGQDKLDKATIQKHKGQLNMFQHGDKILIVNNPQISGQNKIKLNPQQQQLLTGGKLAPGTRVITSKVIATTSSQGPESSSKMSTSKSPSKSTQKLVISKGGFLSNNQKSVIINSSKLLSNVPGSHTITGSKGQTLITHNIINSKGGIILPSPSQSTSSSSKATAIITSQALSPNKGMILAPITSKGGTIISGNQKLRIVSSKASISGTRLVVQNSQGGKLVDSPSKGQQVKLISGLRGQPSGNTILIQTSQGLVAKSISSSTATTTGIQSAIRAKSMVKSVMTTIPTQAKIRATSVQQPSFVKKAPVQKIKQSPNILQKPPRKSTPRGSKSSGSRLISPAVSLSEPIILSPAANITGVSQPTLVQGQLPQSNDGLLYLTVDETGNCRQIENKSMISFEGSSDTPRTIFIPAGTQTQDVGNIFFAIDDAGNIVNITQPATSTTLTSESAVPSQDILAKALANTQVLQQETIIPDIDVSSALESPSIASNILSSNNYSEQTNFHAPSLSNNVLETSLTLNQPIMTPLEVPSAVSPNIGQLSTLPSNFISSNLIATKQKHTRPSMPLLTEESLGNQTINEPLFLLDSSNNIIPATSGSQISFQLTLDNSNVIMTSGTDSSVIPSTYQVVSGDLLATQISNSEDTNLDHKIETIKTGSMETSEQNITYILRQGNHEELDHGQTVNPNIILREVLDCPPANVKNDHFVNSAKEISQDEPIGHFNVPQEDIGQHCNVDSPNIIACQSGQINKSFQDNQTLQQSEDTKHSLKRSFGEEQAVTSSSDLESEAKRIRIDER